MLHIVTMRGLGVGDITQSKVPRWITIALRGIKQLFPD
jgi:hypothetical protein